jgi:hypothetical protein
VPPRAIWAFASGANAAGDMVGFARAGVPPGVAMLREDRGQWKWLCGSAPEATPAPRRCWDTLQRVALEVGIPVFVDTGAYAELSASTPIPPRLWEQMLDAQFELARRLGPLAVIVLPDKVGDQATTLRRLRRYSDQVGEILDAGARGVGVLHRGRRSPAEFAEAVAEALGRYDWLVGFPTVRAKWEPHEIRQALDEISWQPPGVHLLGIGPANPRWGEYTSALAPLPASAWASSDAVVLKRFVKREAALGPLTREQDVARAAIQEEAWGALWDPLVEELVDPTEQVPYPSAWLPLTRAQSIAREGRKAGWLTAQEARVFAADPTAGRRLVLERDEPGPEWWLDQEIERAWWEHIGTLSTQTRKQRGLIQLFGERAPRAELPPEFGQMEFGAELEPDRDRDENPGRA